MSPHAKTDPPIKLGSILFTMVEPHKGHEVAYNRWYERDHFYAGCMIGAWQFAGQRFVATRPLKDLRIPQEETPVTPGPLTGSYLALYWILAGHHNEWNRWAVDQVKWLHENGRMFAERDHIHTLLYDHVWAEHRDEDGVPPELALDHRYPGLVVTFADADLDGGASREDLECWYREEHLPAVLPGSPVSQVLAFHPLPLLADAPGDVPKSGRDEGRLMLLWFLDEEPAARWARFEDHARALDGSGIGTHVWTSPFVPTIPGTDTYTDQIW